MSIELLVLMIVKIIVSCHIIYLALSTYSWLQETARYYWLTHFILLIFFYTPWKQKPGVLQKEREKERGRERDRGREGEREREKERPMAWNGLIIIIISVFFLSIQCDRIQNVDTDIKPHKNSNPSFLVNLIPREI